MRCRDTQFICSYEGCNSVFKRNDHLKRHLRNHSGERPYVCTIEGCDRAFTCKSYLSKHMARPHGDVNLFDVNNMKPKREYACIECDKRFRTKFDLKTHSFVHSEEKPFKCSNCDKSFALMGKLRQHEKMHLGYKCDRDGCVHVTYKWSDMRVHIADVHCVHECETCHKMFKNGRNLKVHKLTHEDNREMFKCSFQDCDRVYYKKANLQAHVKRRHQEQVFKCTVEACERVFLHKKSLNNHLEWHSKPKTDKKKKCQVDETSSLVELEGCKIVDDSNSPVPIKDLTLDNCEDEDSNRFTIYDLY